MWLSNSYITEGRLQEGDSLQKGSIIDLVLGKGLSNQRTSVPNLVGMNFQSAKDRIFGASLTLVTSIYDNTIVSGTDSANAFVYKQNPDFSNECHVAAWFINISLADNRFC